MGRRHYSDEEKNAIMSRYAAGGEGVKQMLAEYGVPKSTFNQWLREYDIKFGSNSKYDFTPRNFRNILRQNDHLEDLLSVLQDSYCSPNASLTERLIEAERLYKNYNVHLVCEALNISRGSFYNHIKRNKRENAWYFLRREELRKDIQDIFYNTGETYGARKMTAALRQRDITVSVHLVRELMSEMGLISVRVYSNYLYNKEFGKYKNYINQNFEVDAPNKVWVSDITYFRYKETPYYICVILDLFSRKVVACCVGKNNTTYLTKRTFREAYNARHPDDGLVFHSDRGSNYKAESFCKLLAANNVTQSFSRAHVPYDNAVMESFFGTMKKEELYRYRYRSERELKESIKLFVERYNSERPHEKLKYKTPNQFEEMYLNTL
ncbi:IS3 family transposase [Clostridiales Family XIII bacterium RF-744-FAT-WT-3]|uniref:IS3 family transposase n=1 Tax=Baileyella intestinalis TaxID=2606709 RepID=A0A6A8MCM9_9FIRM|nr:IS3 family transposase [Baileyella intestinalis]MST69226.1 IS3 family transposase [Baileyella intestinalis]